MSEFEQLYREVILDHYKAPRNHGLLEPADAVAEGQNPLCGDEVTVSVRFGEGDVIEDVGFEGRGCAISQAATSMLTDLVKGRTAQEVSTMPKDELLEEIGIPLTPVRLKCALLGLGVLKVALHRGEGHAAARGVGHVGRRDHALVGGGHGDRGAAARRAAGRLDAADPGRRPDDRALPLRRRAPRDRGPLHARRRPALRGRVGREACEVVCPRHGSRFDLRTGDALTLPAYLPVATYPVRVRDDGMIVIEIGD